jgi:CheY-like chemotaxis protein
MVMQNMQRDITVEGERKDGEMKKKVLIVEDEERIRKVISIIIRNDELEIEEATDGQEALNKLEQNRTAEKKFDLIILDLMLPEVDGIKVLEKIRTDPVTEELPVIIVSAKSKDGDILDGLKKGANYYITKPFEPQELINSLGLILKIKY